MEIYEYFILSMDAMARWFHKVPKWLTMTIALGCSGACMIYWLGPVMGFGGLSLLMLFGGVLYSGFS
jgi:hypothetical protein